MLISSSVRLFFVFWLDTSVIYAHLTGCGLNVSNPAPVLSLSNLASSEDDRKKLRLETIAAVIMTKFEPMWETFLRSGGSFEPFLSLYLERWLHSCVVSNRIWRSFANNLCDLQGPTSDVDHHYASYEGETRRHHTGPWPVEDGAGKRKC